MPKVLIVSGYCDNWMIQMMQQKEGVNGCIRKSVLATAEYSFLEGIIKKAYQSDEFIVILDDQPTAATAATKPKENRKKLTDIQEEILQRLAKGQTQNEIAHYLDKAVSTVNNSVAQLKKKFKVRTTAELIDKMK